MADNLKILFKVVSDSGDLNKSLQKSQKELVKTNKSAKKVQSTFLGISLSAKGIGKSLSGVRGTALKLGSALSALAAGFTLKRAVDEAVRLENAFVGLQSISNFFGNDVKSVQRAAEDLASDGLIPLSDVVGSLKNLLLATNGDLDLSVKAFKSFRDIASFNRQGQLELGTAILRTTDGIKNQISTLTDNIGTTENLSSINKRYAESLGKNLSELTEQEKKLGSVIGLMNNAARATGDFQKLLGTFSGSVSKSTTNISFLLAEAGKIITQNPAVIKAISVSADKFKEWTDVIKNNQGAIQEFIKKSLERIPKLINNMVVAVQSATIAVGTLLAGFATFKTIGFSIFLVKAIASFNTFTISMLAFQTRMKLALVAIRFEAIALQGALTLGVGAALAVIAFQASKVIKTFGNIGKAFEALKITGSIVLEEMSAGFRLLGATILSMIKAIPFIEKVLDVETINKKIESMASEAIESTNEINRLQLALFNLSKTDTDVKITVGEETKDKAKEELRAQLKSEQDRKERRIKALADLRKKESETREGTTKKIALGFATGISQGAKGAQSALKGVATSVAGAFLGPVGAKVAGPLFDILSQGPEKTRETVRAFAKAIPDVIVALAESIPVFIEELSNQIPDVIVALADRIDIIIEALVIGMIKASPRIAIGLAKAIAFEIPKALIKGSVEAFKKIGSFVADLFRKIFSTLNPVNLFSKLFKFKSGGKGAVEKLIGIDFPFVKFAKGGVVGGRARVKGDSERNDTVPALLSPGEIVLPRTAVGGGLSGIVDFLKAQTGLKDGKVQKGEGVQQFGFGSFLKRAIKIIRSPEQKARDLASNIARAAENKLNLNVGSVFSQVSNLPGFDKLTELIVPKSLREIIKSLTKIGANFSLSGLISDPISEVKNAVKGATDFIKPPLKKLISPIGLQTGGTIPSGFNNDTFPAMLSSGERVVPRDQNIQLQGFLDNQRAGNGKTEELLTVLIGMMGKPQNVEASVSLNDREFANIMLELSRTNQRVA